MKSTPITAMVALAAMLIISDDAAAQLFGKRSVGSTLSRRARPTGVGRTTTADASADAGTIQGNERFVRGMRGRADFVGGDSRDRGGFVGSQQAETTGTVRTAVSGPRGDTGPDANQGQAKTAAPRTGMYDPRLRIDFSFTPESPRVVSVALTRRLRACRGIDQSSPIVVSVEGETATLRGEVAAERDRKLARLMLLFEPGISQVRNELTVAGSPRTVAARPATGPTERAVIERASTQRSGPREF